MISPIRKQIEASREGEAMEEGFGAETPESPATARRRRIVDLANVIAGPPVTRGARTRTRGAAMRVGVAVLPVEQPAAEVDEDADLEAGFAAARASQELR
ncbi:MAG: hypothetical protein ACK54C_00090 [Betaproteobacteria bacterium]